MDLPFNLVVVHQNRIVISIGNMDQDVIISDVKFLISKLANVPIVRQELYHLDKIMLDSSMLSDHGINQTTIIQLKLLSLN
jgi:hypothetical protein